jgi:hypothetical protein
MKLRRLQKLVEWASRNPERLLLGLTACCLLAFLATIPLPRIDNQLVGSDGIVYYVYLPSLLIDGDLDFGDEYAHFFAYQARSAEQAPNNAAPERSSGNPLPIGPAILWTPFFLLAHLLAHLFNLLGAGIPTNGYGYLYQALVLSGSILYGGAGLLLTYRFASRLVTAQAALVGTVLVALAGNLVYYMTAEPSMAHSLSAFASGLFFYVWMRRRDKPGVGTAVLYGAVGGLMALVRPQDGLFLALPFLARAPDVWRSLRGRGTTGEWWRWLRDGLLAALAAFITFSPQMVVWGQVYGNSSRSPYTYGEHRALFHWLSPRLGAVLFSAWRGLLTWHPVFLLALVGLLIAFRKHRNFAGPALLGFAMQWYLVSSWYGWTQGDAFGGRMFIVCTPIFTLGLALLIDRAAARWSWSAVTVMGGLLLIWNFLLFVEYRFDLVTAERPPTWYDLTVGRVTFLGNAIGRIWR